MIADRIINKLEGVKQTGQDLWLACCPSHDDKSPSLSIREADDRVLIHCWAGCTAHEVVSAVGMELSDLFPERVKTEGSKPISRPFPAIDILKALRREVYFLFVCASGLVKGETLNQEDYERLKVSAGRFESALREGGLS